MGRLEEKGSECTSPTILESDLQNAVLKAINQTISGRDEFLGILMNNIATVLGEKYDKDTNSIEHQLKELQNELIKQANSKEDYEAMVDEIYRLREVKQETLEHNAERHTNRQRVKEMEKFLRKQGDGIKGYDDKLVRRLVEQATVEDKRLLVRFKSGIEVEVGL